MNKSCIVKAEVETRIPTRDHGEYRVILYTNNVDSKQHLALIFGSRIQSKSLIQHTPASPVSSSSSGDANALPACNSSIIPVQSSSGSDGTTIISETEVPLSHTCTNIKLPVLTRVHSSCFTGETLFSSRCDCAVFRSILMRSGPID
jgi:GTP cyclohydrolase II